ncbi:RDD family protein [Dyella sp. SG609]|uniref:RDD family protein n=1 Tax=Dyella sp. SG609 TaxID=2587018 RepID=UPI0017D74227|nr:RDD family protein [Dyella sp. SG609]NKJ20955.1 putative RDD family membrane protein YckC [Dyella sp. SG609]
MNPSIPNPSLMPATLPRRLLALFYDLWAVIAILAMVGYACQRATGGQLIATAGHVETAWWYQPLQGLVLSAYFIASWLRGGQTLGMRPWRLRLVRVDGGRVRFAQALIRLLAGAAPLLLLELARVSSTSVALWAVLIAWVIYFAWALTNARRRALHDVIAGTEVVRIA